MKVPMPEYWDRCTNPYHWMNVIIGEECSCGIKKEVEMAMAMEAVMQHEEKENMKKLPCNDLLLREIFIKFGDKNGNKNY